MGYNRINKAEAKEIKKAAALKYDGDNDIAPKLHARGAGELAEEILALCEEHNIPVRHNKELVDILYQLELNQLIPIEVYEVVAEIITKIEQIGGQGDKR